MDAGDAGGAGREHARRPKPARRCEMTTAASARISTSDAPRAWVEAFTAGWNAPASADGFADHFEPWLAPDVRLVQPGMPVLTGLEAFRERFARPLFALIPDLHGEIERSAVGDDAPHRNDAPWHAGRPRDLMAGLRPRDDPRRPGPRARDLWRSPPAAAGGRKAPPDMAGANPGAEAPTPDRGEEGITRPPSPQRPVGRARGGARPRSGPLPFVPPFDCGRPRRGR